MAPASFSDSLSIRGVDFSYPSAPDTVIADLTASFPVGFTGIAGANGAGKSTLLKLASGLLTPEQGTIEHHGDAVYCAQRTDEPPADFERLLDETGAPVYALRSRLGIEWDWYERWNTLSHGERKRAQIGCAIWRAPTVLAIDEPTNHLDTDAGRQLIEALKQYRGIGLIVSHDRAMLDELCSQCLWLDTHGARMYPGGYTDLQQTRAVEATTSARARDKAVRARDSIRQEETVRREQALKAHRSRSKRGIPDKDHSAKAEVNGKRVADAKDGQRLRQISGRAAQAEEALDNAHVDKTYRIGIELPGTICRRDSLFRLPGGSLAMGQRKLDFPDLLMRPADRIAITGPNGHGKSMMIAHILANLNVEAERVIYMPQEMTATRGAEILSEVKALPKDELGHAMNVVSALGSRPGRLLDSHEPSPGELRKLLLALGMTRRPYLLVLDEPTNHLDLPSIEALEAALAECTCGLLLVSHDQPFLDRLTTSQWRIKGNGENATLTCD